MHRRRSLTGRGADLRHNPIALILCVGALWTTATAPHDPAVMWPTAAWLWLTTLFTVARAAREGRRRAGPQS
jgi:hypothetical protein